jgi:hypothetical protein
MDKRCRLLNIGNHKLIVLVRNYGALRMAIIA